MWRRTEARRRAGGPPASYSSALLSLLLSGCGSHVVVAEQLDASAPVKTESDAHTDVVGGDATSEGAGVLMCGHSRCTNHPASILGVQLNGWACCADAPHSICGVVEFDNCIPLNQPGHPEDSCMPVMSPQLGNLPGCCRPGGSCGSFENTIGIGCIFIPFLTPVATCTY